MKAFYLLVIAVVVTVFLSGCVHEGKKVQVGKEIAGPSKVNTTLADIESREKSKLPEVPEVAKPDVPSLPDLGKPG